MRCLAIDIDERSVRHRVDRAVIESHLIKHHVGSVRELHAKPIPPNLVRSELIGCPLVIEPARAGHIACFSAKVNRPVGRESRD